VVVLGGVAVGRRLRAGVVLAGAVTVGVTLSGAVTGAVTVGLALTGAVTVGVTLAGAVAMGVTVGPVGGETADQAVVPLAFPALPRLAHARVEHARHTGRREQRSAR
jgi:hypothetical protein